MKPENTYLLPVDLRRPSKELLMEVREVEMR
jgi:hypothetical protein